MAKHDTLIFEVKSAGEDGTFEGILSKYGNVDLAGDICLRGCFAKDIALRGVKRPLLWQHDRHAPIGSYSLKDSDEALLITGRFNLEVAQGREAYALVKAGDITGLSIGFVANDVDFDADGHRLLKEVTLFEGSVVTFPCNTEANITSVKEEDPMASDELKEALAGLEARIKACEEALEALGKKEDPETDEEEKEDSKVEGEDEEEEKALKLALEHLNNAINFKG